MIVDYFDYRDRRDAISVYSPIVLKWDRIVVWFENESIRVLKVDCVLPISVLVELVPPVGARCGYFR